MPGELVAGRLDPSPSPDTLLLLPSGISVSGIETWVRKLADVDGEIEESRAIPRTRADRGGSGLNS